MLSLKQARTRFVRPGGPGGQKTNKQKAENLNRLKFKKMHGDKKRSRKGGGPV
ncbi:hypothetical protein M7I_2648 [Glarea lozoyensis 74030]|uniref:Prokaryotic-type class I peptide chain release factors domain-containing protein n=1 Tax=Glarea lozoyensis (strain ATCC 74030 / MF5533) TaxID=1104152 RepID=H0EJC3_GLAL7|nr:hypothetical protein M7I_2648 [Glarea lozoyensis 74030]